MEELQMKKKSVCPWWMGYVLASPIRKLRHNPYQMLKDYVYEGMTVIDYGSAMGYFSLPMAQMVGEKGRVFCFDVQQRMLEKLIQRAMKRNLGKQIEPILVTPNRTFVGLKAEADFALLFAVAHEVDDQRALFSHLHGMMKPQALLLFAEPAGHVSFDEFMESVHMAERIGFKRTTQHPTSGLMVVLERI